MAKTHAWQCGGNQCGQLVCLCWCHQRAEQPTQCGAPMRNVHGSQIGVCGKAAGHPEFHSRNAVVVKEAGIGS